MATYVINPDGSVTEKKKKKTTYVIGSDGSVTIKGVTPQQVPKEQRSKKSELQLESSAVDAIAPVAERKSFWDILLETQASGQYDNPAAAVGAQLGTAIGNYITQDKNGEKWYEGWFQKGASEEDVSKAIIGTSADAAVDVTAGGTGIIERAIDWVAGQAPNSLLTQGQYDNPAVAAGAELGRIISNFFRGNDIAYNPTQEATHRAYAKAKEDVAEFIEKDLIDEETVAKEIVSRLNAAAYMYGVNQSGAFATPEQLAYAQQMAQKDREYIENEMEEDSVFAHKTDELMQSVGQLAGTAAISATGVPWWLVSGTTAWGSEIENALKQGATLEEANLSGAISATAEILTEKISGGIKFGGYTLDDMLTKQLAANISSKFWRYAAKMGMDMAGEGLEEVLSEDISRFGQWLTYQDENTLVEMLWSEEAMDAKIQAFMSGMALGGGGSVNSAVQSTIQGVDAVSGLTKNEQAVVDQVYKDRVAEEQKTKELTQLQKNEIYEQVVKDMDDGRITTDEIEKVLSKEELSKYKALSEEADEYAKLYDTEAGKMSQKQTDRLKELTAKNSELSYEKRLEQARQKITKDTAQKVSGDRLNESYLERDRKNVAYTNDAAKYKGEFARKTVQSAIDSKVLNNTRYSHRFVDLLAKIAEDRGVAFDFTNNKKLKETGMALEGVTVNGFLGENGITINANSSKALNSVVGHEVTHVLEGTDMYQPLEDIVFEFAKATNQYDKRMQELRSLYEGKKGYETDFEAKLKKELVADLVGDYIFTDEKFVESLFTKNRSLWDKVKHEIDYLFRVATAGSEEARKIEKAKKVFEKVYESKTKKPTGEGGVQYSLGEITDDTGKSYGIGVHLDSTLLDNLTPDERKAMVRERIKELGGEVFTAYDNSGNAVDITIAKPSASFKNHNGKRRPVNHDLTTKYIANEVKQEAVVLIDELISTSKFQGSDPAKHSHGWLDNNGQNDWDVWTTYIQDKNNTIWEATLHIANTANGEKIIYDVVPTKKVGQSGNSDTSLPNKNIAQNGSGVNSQNAEITDAQNEKGLDREQEATFSLSRNTEYMDNAIAFNNKGGHAAPIALADAQEVRGRVADRMNEIKAKGLVALPEDIEGNTAFANSSYDVSEENTTICPRSLASEAFVDAVSEYLGRPLSVEEQIYISQDLQGRSLTPECTYCYVATDRKAYRAFLGEYISQRDNVIQKLKENPDADVSRKGDLYKEFLNGRKDTNPMYGRFKMWVDSYKNGTPMVEASHLANMNKLMGDINSEFGAELKPQIVDAMKYAQSASWAKKRVNYVAYNGHILKWKQDRINKLNSHYGLRMYSFSDFHPAFVLENMQMITDASVRGLKMLGYTKDTDFVDIFAPSGMNINVSTFGFEAGGNVYENNLIGAEWEKAKALRAKYPNVGITFVATNDTLVKWALKQDWIDVVIPYHLVRTGTEVAKAFGYTNYTGESSDAKTGEWKKGDKKYIAPTEHNNDLNTYLEALNKNHLRPRFQRFLDDPETRPYYMKLVNECRQSAAQSQPVQPIFNEDAAMKALAKLEANGYYQPVGGSVDRMYEIAAEVAENMTNPVQASLSADGDTTPTNGWNIRGEDVAFVNSTEDLAPIGPNAKRVYTPDPNNLAPLPEKKLPADNRPITTAKERLSAKLSNSQKELANNQRLREESNKSYDEKIAKAQALYDSKKNKDTKVANNLKRRIERLQRLKADVDAEYAKRISDIETTVSKTGEELQKDHTKQDELERTINRINRMLEYDKGVLGEEFAQRRESLENKDTYISQRASELYNEIRNLKKGVKASELLGELLDTGYEWSSIRAALVNIKHTPGERVNVNSAIESIAREMLNDDYEDGLYNLDDEYHSRVKELETEAETKRKNARVANQRKTKQGEYADQMAELIGDTSTWVDKKLGIQYEVNTLRRNLRDIVRDANGKRDIAKADAIYDELQGKYNAHEAMLNRESNMVKKPYADMKINKHEDAYIQMLGEFRHNPDTTLTQEVVDEFYQKHKNDIDTAKVDKAIEMARETYDSLLERVNAVLKEQGMKEIPYRQGYFPHFTDDKQSFLAKLFNWKVKSNEIPTDIAGLTEQFNPNRSWQSFNKERKSDTTDYSFQKGLDTYVQGALDWVYHIEDIQKRRAFENHIRYVHSDKGVQAKIDAIRANKEFDADEAQEQIDLVLKEANNPLGNFVTDFRTGTNTLANKKSSMDRGLEQKTNRKVYSVMTNLSNRVSANMVGGSISSALTNFIPITQSWGEVSPVSSLRAMADTIRSTIKDDGTIDKSDFLTNRLRKSDSLYKTGWDKVTDKAGIMMEAVDSFTSQTVWRSKYMENISKGMSESAAIKNADQFAENVMAGRSRGNMPTIFDSKSPLTKIFTAFQLEVANQYGYMLKDMPQDMKSESVGKLAKGYATMFMGAYAYNALYSSLVGRDAAFDPIGIIEELLRDMGLFDDEEEEAPVDVLMNFTENILEEVPFVGGLMGGGRIPISSALPYDGNIMDMVEGTGKLLLEGDTSELTEWLNPLYYLALPMGGGQIRKTVQGLNMFSDDHPVAGSYTDSGALRFPVEDTWQNRLQAGLFGQWANENAQQYIDEGRSPLQEKQIDEFIDVGLTIQDYWRYRDGLKGLSSLAEKADYIDSLDLTDEQKNVLINNLADRKEDIDMSDYGEYGSFEEFDYASKNPEKYAFLQENNVSYNEYMNFDDDTKDAYDWAYKNPAKHTLSKAITGDVAKYRKYTSDLYDIKADKDSSGKSISNSRKKKVVAYINDLDMDYGQKILLYRSEYTTDDRYNRDIVEYLNSRDDISAAEMRTILEALNFKVSEDGKISW